MSRMLTLGGVAGPILFTVIVVTCGALRPEYSHLSQFISELGEIGGPNAGLMNYAGFMVPGALILVSGLGLVGPLPRSGLTIAGAFLVALFGAGVFAAGVFSCDPGCLPENPSREGFLHNLVSLIAFVAMIAGVALLGFQFRRMPGWPGFALYSFLTAAAAAALLLVMMIVTAAMPIIGLVQRVFLGVLFLWLILVSIRSRREP